MRFQSHTRTNQPDLGPPRGPSSLLVGQRRHEILRHPSARRILSVERRLSTHETDTLHSSKRQYRRRTDGRGGGTKGGAGPTGQHFRQQE